jgi:hypothetical protein
MIIVACSIALLLIAGVFAAVHAPLVGVALWATGGANIAILTSGFVVEANHPLRIMGPLVPMVCAYLEMHSPRSEQAYSIARLVFSLAFAGEFASLFFVLWGEWPLPLITIVVCLGIVAHSIAPRKVLKWLPF